MNDARIARARIEGNVKGQRWLEAVHTMAERVRRRAAHGVGECAEMRRHFMLLLFNTTLRTPKHESRCHYGRRCGRHSPC